LRQFINNNPTSVSEEYAIMDFNYENECTRQMIVQMQNLDTNTLTDGPNLPILQDYVNGNLPINGRPWLRCKYLLIPCSYPGNTWYLYCVNIDELKTYIYDCSNNNHTPEQVRAHSKPAFAITTHFLMHPNFTAHRSLKKKNTKRDIKLEIMPHQPSANNG
jgi:hypothetical protein